MSEPDKRLSLLIPSSGLCLDLVNGCFCLATVLDNVLKRLTRARLSCFMVTLQGPDELLCLFSYCAEYCPQGITPVRLNWIMSSRHLKLICGDLSL